MKCICYSLFGAERARQENCFDFYSYLRGFMVNIRMNRLLFPGWRINLQTDQSTYNAYKDLFDKLDIDIEVHQDGVPLTLAMLWRLRPCFDPKYTHVLCRDVDSPPTYREAQAVKYWLNRETKAAHAITDSISHNIPMMGGMIGFDARYFKSKTGANTWRDLINKKNFDWTKKGNDQNFLCDVVYPCFAQSGYDSITQHYVLGMANTFLSDYHNHIQPMELDIPFELSESNDVCGHIGAAGFYPQVMFRFLRKHKDKFEDILEVEKQYPNIFYWTQDGTFE